MNLRRTVEDLLERFGTSCPFDDLFKQVLTSHPAADRAACKLLVQAAVSGVSSEDSFEIPTYEENLERIVPVTLLQETAGPIDAFNTWVQGLPEGDLGPFTEYKEFLRNPAPRKRVVVLGQNNGGNQPFLTTSFGLLSVRLRNILSL
jgi:hypothetical protein